MSYRWKEIELLVSELAGAGAVGVDLTDALRCAKERLGQSPLGKRLDVVSNGLQAGQSLSEALARVADRLPPVLLAITRAGEVSGRLPQALSKYLEYLQMRRRLQNALLAALVYPAVVLTLLAAISVVFYAFVYGPLQEVALAFIPTGQREAYLHGFLPVRLALLCLTVVIVLVWLTSVGLTVVSVFRPGSATADRLLLRLPVYGRTLRHARLYHLSAMLDVMLSEGVPLREALATILETPDLPLVGETVKELREAIEHGTPLSRGLAKVSWFPRSEVWLLERAEERENVEQYFRRLAARSLEDFGNLEVAYRLLEPALICVLGLLVGSYVASIFAHFQTLHKWL
ncbi:MAG: hypothetical protein D6691_03620 [Candidatus Hydrogenedentota bacterium]|jgi:type II secretory pathway component PulF|uniref:Type IV fimbrial assembly protein PilC n=1 Tax=Sumerlaea chitinivorans TaxID=2250252 RepID=A0A2Z4Y617_SUMC1|nr:Type IV fimbrial assembly protein PilC [Candidatus Sumerlaea chitinivorans]RMH29087.1 MAG: hypothetical protein D6691_03620 [Candidatus Hydrogenedentota bacterium]GIX44163.1 MAG: fimbrial assembly protein PilC [Candidatus Sumerlaea sp.]